MKRQLFTTPDTIYKLQCCQFPFKRGSRVDAICKTAKALSFIIN